MKFHGHVVAGLALLGLLGSALAPPTAAAGPVPGDPEVIVALPYEITRPGPYVLGANLTGRHGITIVASGVTLDLRGFVLKGADDSFEGIGVRGNRHDIEIFGGTVTGWGMHGIQADTAYGGSFHDLRISGNGTCGLRAGHGAVVENVLAEGNGGSGIQGFGSVAVTHSEAGGNGLWGVDLGEAAVVQGLSVMQNGSGGILVADGSIVRDNAVRGNGWIGIESTPAGCSIGTLAGIAVAGEGSLVERNTLSANGIGLQLLGPRNTVAGNLVLGNDLNYEFVLGNQLDLLVAELPETVLWPAKLTLAGSLYGMRGQVGLEIQADDVTVDLAGHALIGAPGSLCGILVRPDHEGIVVRNGFLTAWDGCGLNAEKALNVRIEKVTAHDNGNYGLHVGDSSTIVDCLASDNGNDGIHAGQDAVVTACSVNGNGNDGLQIGPHSTVSGVTASENDNFGIRAEEGTSVLASTASKNTLGISVSKGCLVQHCTTSFNDGVGLRADEACLLLENVADNNAYGIVVVSGPGSRLEGNNLTNNDIGMSVNGPGNLVIRNTCFGNGTAFSLAAGNTWGPYVNVSGGGALGEISSWANFRD